MVMTRNRLFCVLTGMEHSGTTFLARSLCQLPDLESGFECGVLLGDSPREFRRFEPYYSWMMVTPRTGHWGLSREELEHCCDTDSFDEFYDRVHRTSLICDGASQLIDKTPRYVYSLDRVINNTDVPVLITNKDIRLLYWSCKKRVPGWRRRLTWIHLPAFARRYLLYRKNVRRWLESSRVMIVPHTELARAPDETMAKVCRFLGVEWDAAKPIEWKYRPIREDYDVEVELASVEARLSCTERWLLRKLDFSPELQNRKPGWFIQTPL